MKIKIESVGVTGQISGRPRNIKKILKDDFTYHYIPEAKISIDKEPDIFIEEKLQDNFLLINYPKINVPFTNDYRGLVSICDYLLERARQEKLNVYSLNSSSVQENGRAIIFYGGATNLGKTSSALELATDGFELFSDEKTLLNLENKTLQGGSRSIVLRKKILQKKVNSFREFKKFGENSYNNPKIKMLILPHLDHGLKNPISYKLNSMDSFWHLNKELTRRIRGDTKFFDNYKYPIQSLDNNELSNKRIKLIKELCESIPTYYFQGNLKQLTSFVKERFNK